jgi:hypothetical protein
MLFLLIFQAGGFLAVFHVQQKMIRKQIKKQIIAGIPDHELTVFKIPANTVDFNSVGLKWVKQHEFIYQGKMYDVVRTRIIDEFTWYYCFEDKNETDLVNRLDNVQNGLANTTAERNKTTLLTQILTSQFCIKNSIQFFSDEIIDIFQTKYAFSIKTWSSSPSSPPPKA